MTEAQISSPAIAHARSIHRAIEAVVSAYALVAEDMAREIATLHAELSRSRFEFAQQEKRLSSLADRAEQLVARIAKLEEQAPARLEPPE